MTDDDRLRVLVRGVLPPTADDAPHRDVWHRVASRVDAGPEWSWLDVGLAAAVLIALLMFPRGLILLAYHL